jgi:ribosomal protein S18 acetylase RimI-like enzyme
MSNINIEEATEDDYPRLIEIETLSFSSDLLTIEDLYDDYYSIYVIKEDDAVVGFYISYFDGHDFSYYLETIEIHPDHRRKGYSKKLLDHFIRNSNGPCSLHCHVDNKVAFTLYASNGFQIAGMEDNFYDGGGTAYFLRRS